MSFNTFEAENILVLGAGELGITVLRALAERRGSASRPSLSVLLRPTSSQARDARRDERAKEFEARGIKIVEGDVAADTPERLVDLFRGFSTIVCCTGFVAGPGTQRKITAAVLEAGTDRYVPWQFGVDYDAIGRGSGQDVWDEQLDVRDMLRAQQRTRWTIISTGIFTSFLFDRAFGVVDLEHRRVSALGSWDNRVTVSTPEDIGHLTAAVLAAEPPVDGIVFVAGDTLSYAELADTIEQRLGRKVERTLWTVGELTHDLAAHPDDDFRKYRLAFARDTGVAWDKAASFNARRGIAVTDVAGWLAAGGTA